jgi:hypothetical protein
MRTKVIPIAAPITAPTNATAMTNTYQMEMESLLQKLNINLLCSNQV